jgi:biopolymer transport protein ExbD
LFVLERQRLALPQIIAQLAGDFKRNPNLVVYIRADKDARYDFVAQVIDGCQRNGITRISFRTDPTPK